MSNSLIASSSWFALVVLAAACGGSSDSDGSGGTGASAGSGATAGTGASAGTGGSGGGTCEQFKNDPPGATVNIVFENKTNQDLYVMPENLGCNSELFFNLEDATGANVGLEPGSCGTTCETIQTSELVGCAAACAAPRVLRLAANDTYTHEWVGSVYPAQDMPGACLFEPQSDPTPCNQRQIPVAGTYTLTAMASADCTDCNCDAATGSTLCHVTGGAMQSDTTANATVTLPDTTQIDVVFE